MTLAASRRLLARGRAVAAAGILNAVRRPSARRVLVMIVVAAALVVFCCDALVTGQRNRQYAAEQSNGAPYSLAVRAPSLDAVVDAIDAADPDHRHLTPVVTAASVGDNRGPTVAVDSVAFPRVGYFPLADPGSFDWDAIRAPQVQPVQVTGTRLQGFIDLSEIALRGVSERTDEVLAQIQVRQPDGRTDVVDLAQIPAQDATVPVDGALDCAETCVVTGLTLSTPPGLTVRGFMFLHDLTVDGQLLDLGPPTAWRRVTETGGSLVPTSNDAGDLGMSMNTAGSQPPVMLHGWVPTRSRRWSRPRRTISSPRPDSRPRPR